MQAARWFIILAALMFAPAVLPAPAGAQQAEVRAVLFYSPTCPHCHTVMEQHLPPLMDRFGERLQIISINAATPDGGRLYQDMVEAYGVPRSRLGVPALVVGDRVLVGADEIPQLLPGIVTAGLAAGGIDWPQVSSIRAALARSGLLEPRPAPGGATAPDSPAVRGAETTAPTVPAAAADPSAAARTAAGAAAGAADAVVSGAAATVAAGADAAADTGADEAAAVHPGADTSRDTAAASAGGQALPDVTESAAPATMLQRFMRDPAGNGVAVLVLAGLLLTLAWSVTAIRAGDRGRGQVPTWLIPGLVVCGVAVASYLSFIEVTGSTAVCGPVGDCNTVQQSPYATLFGFLPVGVLGLVGYGFMGGAWALGRRGPTNQRRTATLTLWAAALAGTAFSAYLTFLEPFVIGASCAWCLTSAALTAVILMAATVNVAAQAATGRRGGGEPPTAVLLAE
jgi:uncharacterized membrane protein/thiol-disulfide isomerase/thioredoxin